MSKLKEQYWEQLIDAGRVVNLSKEDVVSIVRSNMLPYFDMAGGDKDRRIYQDYMNYGFTLNELNDKWRIPVPTLRTILKSYTMKIVRALKCPENELPLKALGLDVKIDWLMSLTDAEKEPLALAGFTTLRDIEKFKSSGWKLDRVKGVRNSTVKKINKYLEHNMDF